MEKRFSYACLWHIGNYEVAHLPMFMKIKFLVTALVVGGVLLISAACSLSSLSLRKEKTDNAPIPRASTKSVVVSPRPTQNVDSGIYKQAIAQAMSAANLVQSASSQDDWKLVVSRWQKSVSLLKSIAKADPTYAKAQTKAAEYQKNLVYAQVRMSTPSQSSPAVEIAPVVTGKSAKVPVAAIVADPVPVNQPQVRTSGNCSSFSSHAEAQASMEAGNSKLDGDKDGIACERMLW